MVSRALKKASIVTIPREPTPELIEAMRKAFRDTPAGSGSLNRWTSAYRALVEAVDG